MDKYHFVPTQTVGLIMDLEDMEVGATTQRWLSLGGNVGVARSLLNETAEELGHCSKMFAPMPIQAHETQGASKLGEMNMILEKTGTILATTQKIDKANLEANPGSPTPKTGDPTRSPRQLER